MSLYESLETHEYEANPIDVVEQMAATREWEFDRVGDDRISMDAQGAWKTYSITLALSRQDGMLRIMCTFNLDPPKEKVPQILDTLNRANDRCWVGNFSFWSETGLMAFRYGLLLPEDGIACEEQIESMLLSAIAMCERFYPAFQLVAWTDQTPEDAMDLAISEAYGTA